MPALVGPGWGPAPQGACGEQEQDVLNSGGAPEAWCVVPALVVPGWGHAPQDECGEEEQDVLDCAGALEVWSVELTQPVLAGWLYLPCKCRVLAQDAEGCADS